MSTPLDTNNDHILSSDNTHYLHHDFFEPRDKGINIRATLLIVHGMAEHGGRYADFAQFLADNGIAVAIKRRDCDGRQPKSPPSRCAAFCYGSFYGLFYRAQRAQTSCT